MCRTILLMRRRIRLGVRKPEGDYIRGHFFFQEGYVMRLHIEKFFIVFCFFKEK